VNKELRKRESGSHPLQGHMTGRRQTGSKIRRENGKRHAKFKA